MNTALLTVVTPDSLQRTRSDFGAMGVAGAATFFFLVAVVMTVKTRAAHWIAGLVVSGLLLAVGVVAFFFIHAGGKVAEVPVTVAPAEAPVAPPAPVAEARSVTATQRIESKDGKVSIEIPADWTPQDPEGSQGMLYFGNVSFYEFVFVSRHAKEDFHGKLSVFDQKCTSDMAHSLTDIEISPSVQQAVGGFPSFRHTLSGARNSYNLVYRTAGVETKDAYYEILVWTSKSRAKALEATMDRIIDSFTCKEAAP